MSDDKLNDLNPAGEGYLEEESDRPPARKTRRQRLVAVLPTLLTLGNAVCGFGAITYAAKVGPDSPAEGNHLLVAASLIFLAMVFDVLDGSAARWTRQTSEFGAELDSLCDGVSFGAAPAFLMLKFCQEHFLSRLIWAIAVSYVLCALLRLARFNVETEDDDAHDSFSGLPSPAAAGTVASFPVAMYGLRDLLASNRELMQQFGAGMMHALQIVLPFVTLAVALLMVSRLRYAHIFTKLIKGRRTRKEVVQIIFTIVVVFLVQELAVPLIFCYFAFATPVLAAWNKTVGRYFEHHSPHPSA